MFSSCRATCPSSGNLDKELGQLQAAVLQALAVFRPDSRQAPIPQLRGPGRKPELGQGTWTTFITCFPLAEPLVQVRPGNLDKELGQLRAAVSQALSVLRPHSARPDSTISWPRAETRTWTRTWTRNLDNFYHVFSSCPGLGQGTWTTAGCLVKSQYCGKNGLGFRIDPLFIHS